MLQIKQFTFSPMAENTYVLYNELQEACIIDPGCYYKNEWEALMSFIKNKELSVTHVLLTHAHLDHIFGLAEICEAYKLTPFMHPAEAPILQYAPQMGTMYGLPFKAYNGGWTPLKDKETVGLGKDELQVLHVPGHSPGHVCFYCKNQDFIIGGDVLFQQSIGRTDLPLGDHETLIQHIKMRLFTLPENTKVHPGHGPSTTIGDEMAMNPFLQG